MLKSEFFQDATTGANVRISGLPTFTTDQPLVLAKPVQQIKVKVN